jgi:outer membrane receptor protein involved in Fe transport
MSCRPESWNVLMVALCHEADSHLPCGARQSSLHARARWREVLALALLALTLRGSMALAQPVAPAPPPEIAAAATVSGVVTDAAGSPLAGVTVSIASAGISVVTDSEGRYLLTLPGAGDFIVTTSRDGGDATERTISVAAGQALLVDLALDAQPAAAPAPEPTPTVLSGTVLDEQGVPVLAATVLLRGSSAAAISDDQGRFELVVPDGGTYTLETVLAGYISEETAVTVARGARADAAITLRIEPDLLNLGEVVLVTGSGSGRSKLESSVAISTLDESYVRKIGARSTADVFKSIPGFYVESSGGEGNANLRVRGLPGPGGGKFTQIQEDGLDVTAYGDIMFGNTDIFVRVDPTLARIEGLRGGSSSIKASNAPGGIINMISKTGGEAGGSVAQTLGLTFPQYRIDADYGSPITENLRYHIGGFYRTDDGIRSPGFTANSGGQLKANVTRTFDGGYIRAYFKYLDDRAVAYLPIPLARTSANDDSPTGVAGFDPAFGTIPSRDLLRLRATTPSGEQVDENLSVGMNPNVRAFGLEAEYDLGNGFTVSERFRHSDINAQFNGIFPFSGSPLGFNEFAQAQGASAYTYSYAGGRGAGQPLSEGDLSGLNGNGLVVPYGWWAVDLPLENFTNKFELARKFKVAATEVRATVGYDHNQNTLSAVWWWHNVLADVSDNTRRLDLVNDTTGAPITSNGILQYGTLYRNYWADTRIDAPYLSFDIAPMKALAIIGGFRYDIGRTRGATEKVAKYDYDVDGDGVIASAERNVEYGTGEDIPFNYSYHGASYSISANYLLDKNQAVFAGHSLGRRAAADRTFAFNATEDTADGFPKNTKLERVFQTELGYKLRSDQLGLFATGFYSDFPDFSFTDFETNPSTGAVESVTRFAKVRTLGLELETVAQYRDFSLQVVATVQRTVFADFETAERNADGTLRQVDYSDNTVPGSPALFYLLRPEYRIGRWADIGLTIQGNTKKWIDNANTQRLAGFAQVDASATYHLSGKLELTVQGSNLFNTLGLTEGNPRAVQLTTAGDLFFARPIPGRSAIATLRYAL